MLREIRDQLLQGLTDETESIRQGRERERERERERPRIFHFRLKMYSFWNVESRLSADTLERLVQLLAVLYSSGTERQFLFHSTNLLLELTSRSPDYNRSIFDSPLSECKFEVRTYKEKIV